MGILRRFYEATKSKKYGKLFFDIYSGPIPAICKIALQNIKMYSTIDGLEYIFKKTEIINKEGKWSRGYTSWCPFILPKHSTLIKEPSPFPRFINQYGEDNFILALRKIVDEYDGKTKTVS
jgi:hypothetical protein